jgi:hypothetical protein
MIDQTRALKVHYSAFHVDGRKQQVGGRGCIIARRAKDGPSECRVGSLGRRLVVGWLTARDNNEGDHARSDLFGQFRHVEYPAQARCSLH